MKTLVIVLALRRGVYEGRPLEHNLTKIETTWMTLLIQFWKEFWVGMSVLVGAGDGDFLS